MHAKTARMVLGAVAPLVAAALVLARAVVPDAVISFIAILLSVALLPGIIENFRKRTGWSQESTLYTTTSLFGLTVTYFVLGLAVSTITVFAESMLWAVLAYQAFAYNGKLP